MIEQAKAFWAASSIASKAALIGGLLLMMMLFVLATNRITSHFSDRKFNKAIEEMKIERDALKEKADAAEQRAVAAEGEKARYQIAFEVAGERAKVALKKVDDAEIKYQDDLLSINSELSLCERVALLRAELKLPAKECAPTGER
jgi:hypothetical protein